MRPIQDLLHRIRWDRGFGQARFEIGYYDRVANALIRVPLETVRMPPGDHYFLEVMVPDGALHSVPLHRVHAVWRDGILFWSR